MGGGTGGWFLEALLLPPSSDRALNRSPADRPLLSRIRVGGEGERDARLGGAGRLPACLPACRVRDPCLVR